MKNFKEFLNEEMMPYAQTEKGFVGVDNGPVRDNINIHLAAVTARPHATPYHAMEMVRKVLAPFSIFPPQTNFLDGDSGHEVFQIKQFGDKMGMTNDGEVVVKNFSPYYVYFEYQMNDMGSFDIFCEIVTEDELEEIMSDIEDEMEEGETTDGDEADAEDSFDSYKAGNDLKEDYPGVQRRSNKSLDPDLQKDFKDYKSDQQAKHSSNMVKMSWQNSPNQTYKMMGMMKPWQDTDSRAKYDATRDKIVDKQNQREIRRNPPITVKEEQHTKGQIEYRKYLRLAAQSKEMAEKLGPKHQDYKKHMADFLKYRKKMTMDESVVAEETLDEKTKKAPDRVVTASKKAKKGTKWKLQARDMDSDGSSMELRQGKRIKMTGVFDRHAQDFTMSPAKKNKTDWKAKSKTYDDPKDIMKTVKEENLDERNMENKKAKDAFVKRVGNAARKAGDPMHLTNKKTGIRTSVANKIRGRELTQGKNRLEEEQLNELRGKGSVDKEKLKKHILKKHDAAWEKTIEKRKKNKSSGPADTRDEDKHRNRLGKMYNKLKEEKDLPWDSKGDETKTPEKESTSRIKKITKKLAKQGMSKANK